MRGYMIINKNKVTEVALSFVVPLRDYDKEDIIANTATELARQLHNEFVTEMAAKDEIELRRIFSWIVRNAIDWPRINRKAHPDEYADSTWRMAEEIARMEVNL